MYIDIEWGQAWGGGIGRHRLSTCTARTYLGGIERERGREKEARLIEYCTREPTVLLQPRGDAAPNLQAGLATLHNSDYGLGILRRHLTAGLTD